MSADTHEIDYEALLQAAMRGMVRTILLQVAKTGRLPGDHHFYIAFNTEAPGVSISKRLREKYPHEMTIVLQHRFWDLLVHEDRFEVKLTFDAIPERLVVPFSAIKVFWDPSVPYGHQFEDSDLVNEASRRIAETPAGRKPAAETAGEPGRTRAGPRAVEKRRTPTARKTRPESQAGGPADEPAMPAADDSDQAARPQADAAAPPPAPETPAEPAGGKVISLDKFRKK